MVRSGTAFLHQFVSEFRREREIGEMISVEMSELDLAEPELDAAEAVRVGRHAAPARHCLPDGRVRSLHL